MFRMLKLLMHQRPRLALQVTSSSVFVGCLISTLLTGSDVFAAERVSPPNIVLIVSDDQTYTDFGFMGHPHVQTPHLDQLAEGALLYTHGYVPTSVCRPSLVTLLTGKYPHQHGVTFNHPPPGFSKLTRSENINAEEYHALRQHGATLIHSVPTLPGLLSQLKGYRSFQTGKYWEGHWRNARFTDGMTLSQPSFGKLGDKTLPNGDVVAHGNGDAGLAIGRETMQPIANFLDDLNGSPFFLWYAPFLPHTPHDSPQKFRTPYENHPHVQAHQVPYFAAITQFDDTVGQLMQLLQDRDKVDNTIFVFVVDNGWEPDREKYRKELDEWDHTKQSKRSPFEAGLRTPLFIRWDGHVKPQRLNRLVSSVDIVPTLLKAVRIETAELKMPESDLLDADFQRVPQAETTVFGEIYPGDASEVGHPEKDIAYRWIRHGDYKLIVPHRNHGKPPWASYLRSAALYKVSQDPQEKRNLISDPDYLEISNRLRSELNHWWTP